MSERDVCEMGQLEKYYANNGKRIKHIVNQILKQFGGISQKDLDDFYSVANETFVIALKTWDKEKDFDAFVYTCIKRKILTEITRRNRQKRQADVNTVSLDGSNNSEQFFIVLGKVSQIFFALEYSKIRASPFLHDIGLPFLSSLTP